MDIPIEQSALDEIRSLLARILSKQEEHDGRFDAHDARFDAHDARFDAHDARFDAHDARFDAHDARFDAHDKRFDELHFQLVGIEQEHGAKLEALFDGQLLLTERVDRLDGRMDRLDGRMDRLEGCFDRMNVGQRRLHREVNGIRRSVDQLQIIASDHEHRLPGPG